MTETDWVTQMRAVVLEKPGPPESLEVSLVPIPEVRPGWVRIKVEAFGLNRSEYHLRAGLATGATFPIIPGIEATGTVDLAPGGEFEPGQQVVAMMGGMGRQFDGGYAEYTVVPVGSVVPVQTSLDWATLGALPEMLQTAHGSLHTGLGIQPGQVFLVRGGTSSVGVAAAVLAKEHGLTVLSTTRNPRRLTTLRISVSIIRWLMTATSPARCGRSFPRGSTRRWNWSGRIRCPTPCKR